MPYAVREREGKFVVINTDTEEVKGEHDSKEKAIAQMRALYSNVDDAKHVKIGMRNNYEDRAKIRTIRKLAGEIHKHTKDLEPSESDDEMLAADNAPAMAENIQAVMNKSLNFTYAKSLGLELPDPSILAVKSVGVDTIRGYTFLWGNDKQTDVEREYFTKKTDFWDERLGKSPRPLTWDHAQDDEFKAAPVIGAITEWGDDDLGRWYEAKLDRSHKYRKMIDKLIEEGVLGTSSDSAPQYVVREKTGKATWLKQWPWFASALTDVPAEPRMIGSLEFLKSLGVLLPEPESDASRWGWERARIQLLKTR